MDYLTSLNNQSDSLMLENINKNNEKCIFVSSWHGICN